MSAKSAIEWTEATWNPTLGCSKISPGCKHCYAMRVVHRLAGNPNLKVKAANEGLTIVQCGEPNWTGKVRLIPERLEIPLRTRKPTTYFVNSLSDLFHEDLADEDIDRVFAAMALCPQHRFQVLTKRSDKLCRYFNTHHAHGLTKFDDIRKWMSLTSSRVKPEMGWPLPNVWLGVSVESRDYLHRIDHLRQTPAAVRFLSLEPLLEDLGDISEYLMDRCPECGRRCKRGWTNCPNPDTCDGRPSGGIDWVIVGGESGPGARPMHPDWVRNIREQCVAAGVAFFFKQWGGVQKKKTGRALDGRTWDQMPHQDGSTVHAK